MTDYPDRASLIADMCAVIKAARRPLDHDWNRTGLDREGWHTLFRLANRLCRHLYFEHMERNKLRDALQSVVLEYRATAKGEQPKAKALAAEVLDGLAQEPMTRTVLLGLEHLKLPHGTVVGEVTFIRVDQETDLEEVWNRYWPPASELACQVEVQGGSTDFLVARARSTAETALGIVRLQTLFGFNSKIYLDQIMFGFDGLFAIRDGQDLGLTGRSFQHVPMPMELDHPNAAQWRDELHRLSDLYQSTPRQLRERIDNCVDWLDVAALSDVWRIIIPAIFTALEAILVPETSARRKAGMVTVRSVAVHVALEKGFFDPGEIMAGYDLRSDLIHGTPTSDVMDKDATEFAEERRLWAFRVLRDYLELAQQIGAEDVQAVVAHLDGGACKEVCTWLEKAGADAIVTEYRESLGAS